MKNFLFAVLLLSSITASAQKLSKPTINAAGDTVWTTSKELMFYTYDSKSGSKTIKFWVTKSKGEYVLSILFQTMNGQDVFLVNEGQKAYFTLADNSVITLTTNNTGVSKYGVDEAGSVYTHGSLVIPYPMTLDDAKKLMTTDSKILKIEMSESNYACQIDNKAAQKLKKSIDLAVNAK